jgi:LysM repeat protein
MTRPAKLFRRLLLLAALLLLGGCLPTTQSQLDEEKEPHFLAGKSRVNTLDFNGAIESFEKALEVNPQSASAHFELAWLYEQKENDPAAAIYHYNKYLHLRPKAENADLAKQHILFCKQALASTVSLGPISEKQQRDLEKLAEENKQLTEYNKKLTDLVAQSRAMTNTPPAQPMPARSGAPAAAESPSLTVASLPVAGTSGRVAAVLSSAAHSHTVKAGETLAQIARKYGVRLNALMAANPHLDPRRLQVGQTLSVPAQ